MIGVEIGIARVEPFGVMVAWQSAVWSGDCVECLSFGGSELGKQCYGEKNCFFHDVRVYWSRSRFWHFIS